MQAGILSTNRHCFQKDYDSLDGQLRKDYHDWAWKGDRLTAMVIVRNADVSLEKVGLRVSDFKSEDGEVLSKNACMVRVMKEVDAYLGRGFKHGEIPKGPKEKVADIIHQASSVPIEAHRLQLFYLIVDIPKDCKEGWYRGRIDVLVNDKIQDTLIYSFEVLNLLQPERSPDEFSIELWQYPYTVARYYQIPQEDLFEIEHLKILKEHLRFYKEAGGHAITTTIVENPWNHQTTDPYPSMVKWIKKKNGRFVYDFTHFDRYVDLALSLNFVRQIKSFSMLPWENRIIYYDEAQGNFVERKEEPGTKAWKAIWSSFLEAYVRHLDNRNLFDMTYIALDEQPLDVLKHVLDLIKQHPNKEGKILKVHAAMDFNDIHNPVLNEVDDISLNLAHVDHEGDDLRLLAQKRREQGLTTTIYTAVGNYPNSFAFSDPVETAWTLWYAYSHQVDGFLRWAFDAWVEDPLSDISHWYWESGDPFFIYPKELSAQNHIPYSSPRFEKLKEARRDIAKLQYLTQKNDAYKREAEIFVKSIGRVEGSENEYGAMTAGGEENKNFIDQEVQRLRKYVYLLSKKYLREK